MLHTLLASVLVNSSSSFVPEVTGMVTSEFVRQLEILIHQKTGLELTPPMHKANNFYPMVPGDSSVRIMLKIVEHEEPKLVAWEVTKNQPKVKL